MSGDCVACGEHCLDCSCPEKPDISPTCLRDRLDKVHDLLMCLSFILSGTEYRNYPQQQHQILLLEVMEKIRKIEEDLKDL